MTPDAAPNPEKRSIEIARLPTIHMVEVPVTGTDSPFVACCTHVGEVARTNGFASFATISGCTYVEFKTDSAPYFIPINGCIFAMVVGQSDPMAFAHIPSSMQGEKSLQRDTMSRLVEKAKAEDDSTIYIAGLGERRRLTGLDATDPLRAGAAVNELGARELGNRWQVFGIFVEEMKRLAIPLSRLALSVKGPGEIDNLYAQNAVAVIPSLRMCKVFYK